MYTWGLGRQHFNDLLVQDQGTMASLEKDVIWLLPVFPQQLSSEPKGAVRQNCKNKVPLAFTFHCVSES